MEPGSEFPAENEPEYLADGSIHGSDKWPLISKRLVKLIGADAFQRWFGAAAWNGVENGEGGITVPGEIHQVWIETNYLPELVLAVGETCEGVHHVRISIATDQAFSTDECPSEPLGNMNIRKELPRRNSRKTRQGGRTKRVL